MIVFFLETFSGSNSGRLHEIQRGRGTVYLGDGLEYPEKILADGRYVDENDPYSKHIAAYALDTGQLLGGFKLTVRSRRRPMKMEDYVTRRSLHIPRGAKVAELSRLFVLPESRLHHIALAMWQHTYHLMLELGIDIVYAVQRDAALSGQEHFGLPVERLGNPFFAQKNVQVTPTRIYTQKILPALFDRDPARAYFFSRPYTDNIFESSLLKPSRTELENFIVEYQCRTFNPDSELKELAS